MAGSTASTTGSTASTTGSTASTTGSKAAATGSTLSTARRGRPDGGTMTSMMTVLIAGLPEGAELESVRARVHSSPHFRIVAHAYEPRIALAQARVLLPDIAVITRHLPHPEADLDRYRLLRDLRALDPPTGIILRRDAGEPDRPLGPGAEPLEGAIHEVRRGEPDALWEALVTIGRRRATCDTDPTGF
ncbi:hypothetical protein [Streptomyces sp. NPDC056056]|uniref:hypothetical protein n=1 Tax=Streptomyces sp. NPDC056056 TaxID=3345698 RepID=UPI0035DFD958